MSQAEISDLVGVPTPTYGTWEADRATPQQMVMELVASRIAARFPERVSAAWLMGYGLDGPLPDPPAGQGDEAHLYVIGGHETSRLPRMDSNHQPCGGWCDIADTVSQGLLLAGVWGQVNET